MPAPTAALDAPIEAEPIYKGATRPSMVFGVPLLPFLLVAGGGFLLGLYLMVYLSLAAMAAAAAVVLSLMLWMRSVTKKDDQRLRQALIGARLAIGCPNRRFWRCRSYAPMNYRGGCDAWRR
jgi:type IV secretion system protein VirB3